MRRIVATMLVGSIALTSPTLVFAQDPGVENEEQFNALTAQATEAYEASDYAGSIELFKQAYELRPVSNILYNIARIYEEAGNIDGAIEYYDLFVVAPNVEQTARKDAVERLRTLREVRAVRDGSQVVAEETAPPPVVEEEPETAATLGWVFLGVGGASLLTSGIFGLLAQAQYSNFESATSLDERRSAARAGRTNSVVADSLLVTGIVTAAVGGVVLLISSGGAAETSPETATWTVSPLIGQKAVGMGLELSF